MKAYKIVRKIGNVLCSFTTSNISDLDGENYLKYSTKKWTVSENSPIFVFDTLEHAAMFLKNECHWADSIHYPIYECEYTPYLGYVEPVHHNLAQEKIGTVLASRVKLIREAGKTKKAFKIVRSYNGQLMSYNSGQFFSCCSDKSGHKEYFVGKETLTDDVLKPLFCFDSLESAVNYVNYDYEDAKTENAKDGILIFECEIIESQHPYAYVFGKKPFKGTVFADSVILKKKVFDFNVDNYGEKSNNQNMKIDNQALKLALGDVERYEILYQKDGYNEMYTVSGAIDRDENKVNCYAFGHGVRSFKWDKILSIIKVDA